LIYGLTDGLRQDGLRQDGNGSLCAAEDAWQNALTLEDVIVMLCTIGNGSDTGRNHGDGATWHAWLAEAGEAGEAETRTENLNKDDI